MRKLTIGGIIVVLASVIFLVTRKEQESPQVNTLETEMDNKVDVDLDRESAIQIAEIVLTRVYGKDVLNERPWQVSEVQNIFKIEGTLPMGYVGGVAEIEIRRTNGAVVSIIHGQ
jgi:hypothetical protein